MHIGNWHSGEFQTLVFIFGVQFHLVHEHRAGHRERCDIRGSFAIDLLRLQCHDDIVIGAGHKFETRKALRRLIGAQLEHLHTAEILVGSDEHIAAHVFVARLIVLLLGASAWQKIPFAV